MKYPIIITCTPKEKARIKMFCRQIDATASEFALYALMSEIDFQLEHWSDERRDKLANLIKGNMKSASRL